ncbi:MAG TPA: hypothetical protein VMD53_01585 [Rhizomicrobium sp.]|nr:hypothetical protein [Rhizomicrobium sp.]
MLTGAKRTRLLALICVLAAAPGVASAQTAPGHGQKATEKRLDELKAMKKEMLRTMQDFDARIKKLEAEIKATPPAKVASAKAARSPAADTPADQSAATVNSLDAVALIPVGDVAKQDTKPSQNSDAAWGTYQPGKGFVAVRSKDGELDVSLIAYVRYLNQLGLKSSYTDSFGRSFNLDLRQDVLLNKINLSFKGWLFDPNFEYRVWIWTQNPAMGDPAQVVVGGHLGYHFADYFNVFGGVAPLPTTRSTNWTYPFWLKMDNRTIADEFFRGSYTFGFWANGDITDTLAYRAMIANNLSALGIDAAQLPPTFSTYSVALWWMPTTGEFGTGLGFGDYDYHEKPATMFGIHYTQSPETKQEQPNVNDFENSQIRLSDGTLLFSANPFNTGGTVEKADYHMADANAGIKYLGWSLETEAYARWINNFETIGPIPVTSLFDKGFQVQASAMAVPKELQFYAAGSKIYGQYGDPWDLTLGLNWYPFSRREMHINTEGIYLWHSPVGGPSYPYVVGGTGWICNTDFIVTF